jgi:hypothetical protein
MDTLIGVTADGKDAVKIVGQNAQIISDLAKELPPEDIEKAKESKKIVDKIIE